MSALVINPFPGPQPYRASDRARFYGREDMSYHLQGSLLANRCITVYGPSGAGKSSLMQAAVIPALVDDQDISVARVDGWPEDQEPTRWLSQAVYADLGLGEPPADMSAEDALFAAAKRAARRSSRIMLLYLDQIEQLLYASRSVGASEAFFDSLNRLVELPVRNLRVVLSLREDYLGRFRDRLRDHRRLLDHGFRVGPLTVGELSAAVCQAAAAGEPSQAWELEQMTALMMQVRVPGQAATEEAEAQSAYAQVVCRALFQQRAGSGGDGGGSRGDGGGSRGDGGGSRGDGGGVASGRGVASRRGGASGSGSASGDAGAPVGGGAPDGAWPSGGAPGGEVEAEPILRGYLETTLDALGPLRDSAQRLLEDHLVTADGSRTLRTEKELLRLIPKKELSPILTALEGAAILHAEEHQGSRYFEIGHDWLARRVFEHRQQREREEEQRRREEEQQREFVRQRQEVEARLAKERWKRRRLVVLAAVSVTLAAGAGALGIWAWQQKQAAELAYRAAEEQTQFARERQARARAAEWDALRQKQLAEAEKVRAEAEKQRAEGEKQRAEAEAERARAAAGEARRARDAAQKAEQMARAAADKARAAELKARAEEQRASRAAEEERRSKEKLEKLIERAAGRIEGRLN
ncbi:nSTAND1 domain-containing NTPase [Sorangium sp. So ce341]|uniref:nSTAND1 domain-containing NTPase n=1 Tax=Sorangium sp. So ce341 TaxID=3133302 RepID=UPI003F5FCC5F